MTVSGEVGVGGATGACGTIVGMNGAVTTSVMTVGDTSGIDVSGAGTG